MKTKITLLLSLLICISHTVQCQAKRFIDIQKIDLVRVEPQKRDHSLVFEIECLYNDVKNSELGFVIAPLDEDQTVILDTNDEPLMSGEIFRMTDNTGVGVVEVSVPLSYFPKNTNEYSYVCMIIDNESLDTMADSGPLTFTNKEVKQLLSQKALNQAMDFFDLLLGGGSGGIFGGDEKKGKSKCHVCQGNKVCVACSGYGVLGDTKCAGCGGSGKCHHCHGEGTM